MADRAVPIASDLRRPAPGAAGRDVPDAASRDVPDAASRDVPDAAGGMLPIGFGTCFGWLHPARGAGSSGIVLCPTLGLEARNVHRLWRILADRLASAGHPVLRFDYPDTGDSWVDPQIAEGEATLDAWIDSVVAAAEFLRGQGAARVTLLGLRFGGTLAALAQTRLHAAGAVWADRLILLAPVVSGRSYVRELRALARLSGGPSPGDDAIEASGLVLSAATSHAIAAVDLRHPTGRAHGVHNVPAPARTVLLLDPAPSKTSDSLVALWRERDGRDVMQAPFDGYDRFVASPHTNVFPENCLARICAWMQAAAAPLATALPAPPGLRSSGLHPGLLHPGLRPPGAVERPCRFGEAQRLFGMLCEPQAGARSDLAVIMCNNGSNPHHGHGRFAVTSGRSLAQAGISSFRLDFAGLGDSSGGALEERPHLFDACRTEEIAAAIRLLAGFGYRRFVLTGICAGAYHAFHGALAHPAVIGLYAVNLPKFRWPPGDDPDLVMQKSARPTGEYLDEIRRKETWVRLLKGDIRVGAIALTLLRRLSIRLIAARVAPSVQPVMRLFGSRFGDDFPHVALAQLSQRGVRVHLLYGHDDHGVDDLVRSFGVGGRNLARLPGCSVSIPDDIDHPISHARVRAALGRRMLAFLGEFQVAVSNKP